MSDPMTISLLGVGAVAINEGVKFLYGQAGELLKKWREHQNTASSTPSQQALPIPSVVLPEVFAGQLTAPVVHFDTVQKVEPRLRELYRDLSEFGNGISPIEVGDLEALEKIDMLRRLIEQIYQQRITFRGEERPPSGTLLLGTIKSETIKGSATGVDIQGPFEGRAEGRVSSGEIGAGATVIGVKRQ